MNSGSDAFAKFEHEGWERVADRYELGWSRLTRAFIPHLLEAAKLRPGMRLLDVACGPGYVAEAARAQGVDVTGVDFSARMIRLARRRNPQIELREGDAQGLAFEDQSFDAVVMNFGLLHLSRPEAAFAEAHRVLRSGGVYAFTVWAGPGKSPGARIVDEAVKAHANLAVELPQGPDHFGYGNPDECRSALGRVGFEPASLGFQTVTVEWELPTASFLFESERHAGVRTAALLAAQTPGALLAIEASIEQAVRRYAAGNGFFVPFAAHVVTVTTAEPHD